MAEPDRFSELFAVIEDYSTREYVYQDKALQVITGAYGFMFEKEDMPDARPILDRILEQYDFVFTNIDSGRLDPLSVEAVVKAALYREEHMEWGINRLGKILEGLFRRSRADESYPDSAYSEDARVVLRGLERIVNGSILEDIVEELNEVANGGTDAP